MKNTKNILKKMNLKNYVSSKKRNQRIKEDEPKLKCNYRKTQKKFLQKCNFKKK